MRLFNLSLVFLLAAVAAGRAEVPALLQSAIKNYAADAERWAYTQTIVSKDRKGEIEEEIVVRNDPSQPFDVQWTPTSINGKQPTERQIEKYRKEHNKRRESRRPLGELLNLDKAVVTEETATTVTYEVPLIKNDNQRLPPDKFRVTARVNREQRAFEHIGVRLREATRLALVLKLKSGEADMDFAVIDPHYTAAISALRADGEGTILFVKVGGNYSATRTDFKRVKPYSERMSVKLAPLQFLDF